MLKSADEKDPGWAPSSWTFHCGLYSCQIWTLQLLCCEVGVWVRQEEFCVSDALWALGTAKCSDLAKVGGVLRCSLDISWLVTCPAYLSCPVSFWNRTSPHSSLEFSFCASRPVARAGLSSSSFCLSSGIAHVNLRYLTWVSLSLGRSQYPELWLTFSLELEDRTVSLSLYPVTCNRRTPLLTVYFCEHTYFLCVCVLCFFKQMESRPFILK